MHAVKYFFSLTLDYYTDTLSKFRKLIDGIHEVQPDALVYIQANLHVASYKEDAVINNDRLNALNANLQAMADNSKVYYLDVNGQFDDENGALKEDLTSDGVHVLAKYYTDWCTWLCQNTVAVSKAPAESKPQTESTTAQTETTTQNKKPQNEEFSNI